MPLVRPGAEPLDAPLSEAHGRARKIDPAFTEGELVRVAGGRNQAEAELIQGLLLEWGVPSILRRSAGFDVPDFLAAGPARRAGAVSRRRDRARGAARGGHGAHHRRAPRSATARARRGDCARRRRHRAAGLPGLPGRLTAPGLAPPRCRLRGHGFRSVGPSRRAPGPHSGVHGGARRPGGAGGGRGARQGGPPGRSLPRDPGRAARAREGRGPLEPVPAGRPLRPRAHQLGVRDALRADGRQRRRADGVQLLCARHRQHGDPRRARHGRAAGAAGSSRCSTARSAPASR